MTKRTEVYKETRYRLGVEHKPGNFENDMDYITSNPGEAYKRLQYLKEKYFGQKITITKTIKTTTYETISEKKLLEAKIKNSL